MNQETETAQRDVSRRNSEVLGEILWLYAHSPMHKRQQLSQLERYVFPALKHNRYRIYKKNGVPIGFVALARLSKEIEDRWLNGGYVLQPDDWISGDRLWIMQFVVPFGDFWEIRRKLRYEDPETDRKPMRGLRVRGGRRGVDVVQFGRRGFRHLDPPSIRSIAPRQFRDRRPTEAETADNAAAHSRQAPQPVS